MEIIGGNAFGYIERYDALVKHIAKKKSFSQPLAFYWLAKFKSVHTEHQPLLFGP